MFSNSNLSQEGKQLVSPSCKILGPILGMDERRTSKNRSKDKKANNVVQGLTSEMSLTYSVCQEKKEEENSPKLKREWMHQ